MDNGGLGIAFMCGGLAASALTYLVGAKPKYSRDLLGSYFNHELVDRESVQSPNDPPVYHSRDLLGSYFNHESVNRESVNRESVNRESVQSPNDPPSYLDSQTNEFPAYFYDEPVPMKDLPSYSESQAGDTYEDCFVIAIAKMKTKNLKQANGSNQGIMEDKLSYLYQHTEHNKDLTPFMKGIVRWYINGLSRTDGERKTLENDKDKFIAYLESHTVNGSEFDKILKEIFSDFIDNGHVTMADLEALKPSAIYLLVKDKFSSDKKQKEEKRASAPSPYLIFPEGIFPKLRLWSYH